MKYNLIVLKIDLISLCKIYFFGGFGVKRDLEVLLKTPRSDYTKMLEMNSRNRLAYCSG